MPNPACNEIKFIAFVDSVTSTTGMRPLLEEGKLLVDAAMRPESETGKIGHLTLFPLITADPKDINSAIWYGPTGKSGIGLFNLHDEKIPGLEPGEEVEVIIRRKEPLKGL